MNLLIVDDTPTNLKLLRAQLEAEGHTVFEAHDGVEALALLERQRVDVVISDIFMPKMDGYRLSYEIRKHARLHDLPIILCTSTYTSPDDEKLVRDVGADKYLKRPVSLATLVAALHEVIAQPHAAPRPETLQGVDVLKEYSARLVSKLEEKNTELQAQTVSAERAKATAEEATQAKDRFLAVLSHELRTPLTPVLAAVQLLQRKPGLSDDMRHPLEIIRRNVQLQARLIDDLLDLTRIAQGKLELDLRPLDICTAIERAVEISKPDIDARKLHFGVEMKDAPHPVNGDAARLQQVIWNLLGNAVKFTADGGCVGLRCYREDSSVIIEVIDSGIGVEPEALDRIFDAFEQGGRATTRQFGGLGLGLAIAKRLVEMHEGTISAYSEGRGKGSTFRISLPLVSTEFYAEAGKHASIAAGPLRRILLVEDNGDGAEMMKMLLETFGYQVETAGDVAQALKAIASQDFDLLISDIGLPDRSGLELMEELRRSGNTLKGIAVSGYGHEEDVERSRAAGFSVHLTKPVDVDVLVQTVSRVL